MEAVQFAPPSAFLLALEPLRAISDYFAGLTASSISLPRGDGHPVLFFPGLGSDGTATKAMRDRLCGLDYDVHDWDQGVNQWPEDNLDGFLDLLAAQLIRLHAQNDRHVSLIGWSLGGVYARELGKRHPQLVRQVITLATPFADQPNSTHAGWLLTLLNGGVSPLDGAQLSQLSIVPDVRCTSVYSLSDGLVGWEGCVGIASEYHRNVAVENVSHWGMLHSPEVLQVVAGLLAEPQLSPACDLLEKSIATVF
ncbi:hypothetical protein ABH945_003734 [Paraburkholderia sp. GAS333]|uniref:esterase/lipase family protein n=1 Tax=Paraburkholderia sp. GAS333 TaxID=3156279 RepID=UPI003D1D5B2D